MLRVVTIVESVHSLALAAWDEFRAYPVETLQVTLTIVVGSTRALAFATGILDNNNMIVFWLVTITHPIKSNPRAASRIFA